MGSVRTSILGRPRPLSRDRRASPAYTLNCEEPVSVSVVRLLLGSSRMRLRQVELAPVTNMRPPGRERIIDHVPVETPILSEANEIACAVDEPATLDVQGGIAQHAESGLVSKR